MSEGSLCEADQQLPDGNPNFEINNCNDEGGDGNYDVFVCVKGGIKAKYKVYIYPETKKYIFNISVWCDIFYVI